MHSHPKLVNQDLTFLIITINFIFNLFSGDRTVLIGNSNRRMDNLFNPFSVFFSNDDTNLINRIFYMG